MIAIGLIGSARKGDEMIEKMEEKNDSQIRSSKNL